MAALKEISKEIPTLLTEYLIGRSRNALILDNRRSGAVALTCIFMNVIRLTIIEWGSQRDGGLLQFF